MNDKLWSDDLNYAEYFPVFRRPDFTIHVRGSDGGPITITIPLPCVEDLGAGWEPIAADATDQGPQHPTDDLSGPTIRLNLARPTTWPFPSDWWWKPFRAPDAPPPSGS